MRKYRFLIVLALCALVFTGCKKVKSTGDVTDPEDRIAFDQAKLESFFVAHPDFKDYKAEMEKLYAKYDNHYVWYDKEGRVNFAEILYDNTAQLEDEGVLVKMPYQAEIDKIFEKNKKPKKDEDFLISAMYFFYANRVLAGVDPSVSKQLGWYLPRQKMSLVNYLDTLMLAPKLAKEGGIERIPQYYNLQKALGKFRAIEKDGKWSAVSFPDGKKVIKVGDSAVVVKQVRNNLQLLGDLSRNNGSNVYDNNLKDAVLKYKKRENFSIDDNLTPEVAAALNVPVAERIKTIIVNMERTRWISPLITQNKEYIAVNIPAFKMTYYKDDKIELESNVVVGKELNKTVVFSGKMSYIVFSPYWNLPKSIIAKEIEPKMEADPNYLESHNMEWNGGDIRQKPGKDNSLGLVKFMFPNSNNIYLHDSPAKSLYSKDDRALSHGCVRVQKAEELAVKILEDDKNWNKEKIDDAMNSGTETEYALKRKIPVYISYFTAWADEDGNVGFFDDVYKRDNRLARLLYK